MNLDDILDDLDVGISFDNVVNGDTLTSSRVVAEDSGVRQYSSLSVYDLLPKTGTHLGLDISELSTGIALVEKGSYKFYNHTLSYDKESQFSEVYGKLALRDYFNSMFGGIHFDTIVVEDVYEDVNPKTVRLLYSLNTVIDELIVDGVITCTTFYRANNKTWKSWLWSIESQIGKGLNDKVRTQLLLEHLGVYEEGKGFQDRYDSLGMLVGYFYKFTVDSSSLAKVAKVTMSQISYGLYEDYNLLQPLLDNGSFKGFKEIDLGFKNLSKELIKYYVGLHIDYVLVFRGVQNMEILRRDLKIQGSPRNYFVVWRK